MPMHFFVNSEKRKEQLYDVYLNFADQNIIIFRVIVLGHCLFPRLFIDEV